MENKKDGGSIASTLVAAVAGMALGAAAVVLSDNKNRQKIGKNIDKLKDQGTQALSDVKERLTDMSDNAQKQVEETRSEIKKQLPKAKKASK